MAPSRASPPNGFVRNSTAPAFIACTVIGMSPCPVMKMIGISVRSLATCRWRSSPLRPGSETSSTRQLGLSTGGRARNSCADAKVSARQPSWRISSSSDSRTEMSSSTTKTTGGIRSPPRSNVDSPPSAIEGFMSAPCAPQIDRSAKRGRHGTEQSRLAERLEQALHGSLRQHARADAIVSSRRDVDDWNLEPSARQLLLEIGSGHARHRDVQDQAPRLANEPRREELFGRRERPGAEAAHLEQIRERLPYGLVVVDDRHERPLAHYELLASADSATATPPSARFVRPRARRPVCS